MSNETKLQSPTATSRAGDALRPRRPRGVWAALGFLAAVDLLALAALASRADSGLRFGIVLLLMLALVAASVVAGRGLRIGSKGTGRAAAGVRGLADRVREQSSDLAVAHRMFRDFMRNLPGSAAIKDLQGRYVFANKAFAATMGRPVEEIIGRTAADLFPPAIAGRIQRDDLETVEQRRASLKEEVFVVHGQDRYGMVSRFPIQGPDGSVSFSGAVSIDVTEERRIRDHLRRIEERFRLLVEGTLDYAIVFLDPDGRITTWNSGAQRINGFTEAEIIGRPYSTFFTPDDVTGGKPQRLLEEAATTGRAEDEGWRLRKDGTRFFANAVIRALREPDGRLRGFSKVTRDITDRRRAEEELRDRAHALDTAQRIAHVGSWEIDVVGMQLRGSPEMFRLLGLPGDTGVHPFETVVKSLPADQGALVQEAVSHTIESHEPFSLDVRLVRNGGEAVWLHLEGRAEQNGGIPRIVGTAQDITHRKRLENRVEGMAQRFYALAENAKDAIISAGYSGQISFVNRAGRELFGYSEEELSGQPLTVLMPDRYHEAHRAGFRRFLETSEGRVIGRSVELEGRRKDGTEFPLELSLGTWKQDGQPRFIGILRDITERKRGEGKLQESLERFQVLAEGLPVGVFHTDENGGIDYANRRWMEITGVNFREQEAASASVHPLDLKSLSDAWRHAIARGTELVTEYRSVRPDGVVRECSLRASPVRNPVDGALIGFVGFIEDITDANRLREMERQAQQVEIEQLRALNTVRTQFINTAAHELRTPLVPLRSQLELLKMMEQPDGDAYRRSMGVMERNLDRLAGLVEDLLESARYQSGRLGLESAPHDMHHVVRDATESFAALARDRNIELSFETFGRGDGFFDARRITQVVYNLLSNALKFTEPGDHIRVLSRGLRDRLKVSIIDDGVGIDPKALPLLFQPFSQVHDPREITHPGSGLGLYICKALVELHGGTIEADSGGIGEGAAFTFSVPRRPPEVPLPSLEASPGPQSFKQAGPAPAGPSEARPATPVEDA